MPQTPLVLSASSQALKDSLKALDCYDAYQALSHPYSSKEVDTKHHILVTAICLINESGFTALSMNHVVDHSSVSRRTVYKYFTNKEYLSTDIAILWAIHAQLRLSITDQTQTGPFTLTDYFNAILDFALEYPEVLKAVSAGISYPSNHSAEVYQALEDQLVNTIAFFKPKSKKTQKQLKTTHKALVESLIYNLIVLATSPEKTDKTKRHLADLINLFEF